jgi:hypothetical protein
MPSSMRNKCQSGGTASTTATRSALPQRRKRSTIRTSSHTSSKTIGSCRRSCCTTSSPCPSSSPCQHVTTSYRRSVTPPHPGSYHFVSATSWEIESCEFSVPKESEIAAWRFQQDLAKAHQKLGEIHCSQSHPSAAAPPPPLAPDEELRTINITADWYTEKYHTIEQAACIYGLDTDTIENVSTSIPEDPNKPGMMWLKFVSRAAALTAMDIITSGCGKPCRWAKKNMEMAQVSSQAPSCKLFIGNISLAKHIEDPTWIPHLFNDLGLQQYQANHARSLAIRSKSNYATCVFFK